MSFPKYPAYKDSGVEWVGKIPAGWGVAPLFSISTENRDKNTGLKSSNTLSLSYGNIIERDKNNNFGLLPDSYETYQIVKFGDIIFRLTDLQNDKNSLRSAISRYNGIITSAYLSIKTAKNCCPFYISYLMRAYDCEKVFYSMGGGVRQSLNFKEFKYLPVILPPLPEQQAIASFLDRECGKIDGLIAEQERLIALLAEKRQAVISDAPMKDSGIPWIGMVPEGWDVVRLSLVSDHISSGTTPDTNNENFYDGDICWVTTGELREAAIKNTTKKVTKLSLEKFSALQIYPPGTLLLAMYGATVGRIAWLETHATTNQACCALVFSKKIKMKFVFYTMLAAKESLLLLSSGGGQPNINQEKVRSFRIPVPSLSEQSKIIDFLDSNMKDLDSLSGKIEKTLFLFKERRSALISAAVTGKIDVRAQSKAIAA